jgi:hypothetical protein
MREDKNKRLVLQFGQEKRRNADSQAKKKPTQTQT